MAVALRSVGVSPGAVSADCVITKPAGLAVGDLMIAHIATYAIKTMSAVPSGFTHVRTDTSSTNRVTSYVYKKIADAGDVAAETFTFTVSASDSIKGAISAWTGFDTSNPISAHNGQGNASSSTITAPTITPAADCMILLVCTIRHNDTFSGYAVATDNPASWAEAYDLQYAYALGIALGYALRPETSATGNGTATATGSAYNVGQLIAIAPASEGGGGTGIAKVDGLAVADIAKMNGVLWEAI